MLTLKKLFFKELYEAEILKIIDSRKENYLSLDKGILNNTITLRWLTYNKSFVIHNIIKYLKSKKFTTPLAIQRTVNIRNKDRQLYFFDWHIRILHGVLAHLLTIELEKILPNEVRAYRRGMNFYDTVIETASYIKYFSTKKLKKPIENYIIRKDIKSYGDTINLEILYKVIEKHLDIDNEIFNLIHSLLNFEYISEIDGKKYIKKIGLPTGSPLNTVFTNLYLIELDYSIIKENVFYRRYSDDIIVVGDFSDKINKILESYRDKMQFHFNEEKDGFIDLESISFKHSSKLMIKYLGFFINLDGEIFLTTKKDLKIKKEIMEVIKKSYFSSKKEIKDKKLQIKFITNGLKIMLYYTDFYSHLFSFLSLLSTEYLKELDLWIAKNILKLVYHTSFDKVFQKYSYRDLRKDGLFSFKYLQTLKLHKPNRIKDYISIKI